MNLRNRSLLVLGLTFFVFFIIIALASLSVTLQGLDRIEYQDMGEAVNQTKSALNAESAALLSTTQDWAWWDDMAGFAENHDTKFVDRNANPDNMATVKVHLFIVLDENGNLLYGRLLSPDFTTNTPVPDGLIILLRSNPRMTFHPADDLGSSGILHPPEGLMVVASAPVLRSDKSGKARGTVIMGRYLESGPLQRITDMTGYSVTLDTVGKEGVGLPAVQELLNGQRSLVIVADNDNTISGYSLVHELTGNNLLLRVSMQRELYWTGYANILRYLVLLALWAVMLGIIVLVVIDRTVLQRIDRLTDRVRSFSGERESVPDPVLSGNDELAELEKTIITSRADLLIREGQLRVFVNAIPGPAALFSREGTILLANPAFAEYLDTRPEHIVGSSVRSWVPSDEMEKYNRFVQESIRKKETVHFENETGGKTFLMSYYPLLGNDGEVIQLGLLAFDISERKRLENALQKVTKKIALLNTVIFSDIQNKVFVQMGYLELARQTATDPRLKTYMEKEEAVVREIQTSLRFAKQFNDMGMSPPRWQNVQEVILFAVSHLDLGSLTREFNLEGIEIYADSLLERVFVTLVENTVVHAKEATAIRAGYTNTGDDALIFVEDNGPGIPEDTKEQIFTKGVGASGSTSLFLSREILSITGITIRENGVSGKGARFEIRVPKGSYRISTK
jgi:PAS domain S-box-containing protein